MYWFLFLTCYGTEILLLLENANTSLLITRDVEK